MSGEIVALNFLAEIGSDDFTFKAFVECTPHLASLLKQDPVVAPLVKKHESSLEGRFFNRFHVDDADVDAVRDRCIELGYTWKNSAGRLESSVRVGDVVSNPFEAIGELV